MSSQQVVSRLPQPAAPHAQLPVGSLDVLPKLAAASWPDRVALRGAAGALTFAELDRKISRLASGLRELLGGDGSVVAVSSVLGMDFPVAYYAVVRSGNVVAPVNPRLGPQVLDRLLVSVRARAVILGRSMYDRVRPALAGLTQLEHVLLLDGDAGLPGVPTCAEVGARGDTLVEPRDRDENELGVIAFGGGSAGYAKAAALTHHSLKVDAAQLGSAHGLSARAVALNALPSYHHSHLNAGVWTGTTQVLCASPDPAALVREAERCYASHCYALPDAEHPVLRRRTAVAS